MDKVALAIKLVLLVFTTSIFLFALASGAADYGGGIVGIMHNSPNTLPWLLLYVILFVVWRHEFVGGLMLVGFSSFLFFFFHVWMGHLAVLLLLVVPLFMAGVLLIVTGLKLR